LINASLSQAVPFAPLPAPVTHRELKHCLKTSQANHIFVHVNLLPVALSACNELGIPKDHVYILEGNVPHGFRSFDSMVTTAKKQIEPSVGIKQVKKDTLAYLLFSSGTTGLPKGKLIFPLSKWLDPDRRCSHHDLALERSLLYHSILCLDGNPSTICRCVYHNTALILSFDVCKKAPPRENVMPVVLSFLPFYGTFGIHSFFFRYSTLSMWLMYY